MVIRELVSALDLRVLAGEKGLDRRVAGGYVGDLLSCVMAGAGADSVWVTVQGHPNVVAVATLVGLAGVVVTEGARVDAATLEKADQEGVPLLASPRQSFEVVAGLVRFGVRGSKC